MLFYVMSFLAFAVAAIIALLGVSGVSIDTILGIIAIGAALQVLAPLTGDAPWPAMHWRARPRP